MRVPVTVVTGYLGSGKTTLVNKILSQVDARRFAIIVNEFGDIGIDGDLIDTGGEQLIELSSGCICCVVRGDLIRGMRTLLAEKPDLDGIIIETTGLANPGPVIQTLVVDQVIGSKCRLDAVLCVVDAIHILAQLNESRDSADQIAFSDCVVLNKADDAAHPVKEIESRIRGLNPYASILKTNRCDIPASAVLNRGSFELERVEPQLASFSDADDHDHSHIETGGITSVSLALDAPVDAVALETWLQELLGRFGADILRTKGVLAVQGDDRKLVLQAVNMMLEGDFIGDWGSDTRQSRLVFIGRNLDRDKLKAGFERCRSNMPAYAG